MFDSAINLLGPDIDLLTDIMFDLGKKHVRYGVHAEMYPIMGICLIDTLREILGDTFTKSQIESWKETYRALTLDMIFGSLNQRQKRGSQT
jgi:hemoglobin-like flavoprotein